MTQPTAGQLSPEHSHGGPPVVPEQSRASRRTSFDLADFPVPSGREEEWRFTPLDRLAGLPEWQPGGQGADGGTMPVGKVLVEVGQAGPVTVEQLERGDARLGRAGVPGDRVAAAAWSGFERATVLSVPAGLSVADPVLVSLRGEGGGGLAFGHLLVEVGAHARAVVVLDHTGTATYADNVEILVGPGAELTLVSLQSWTDEGVHASAHHARLDHDARLRHVVVSLGGDLVRITPSVTFAGPGAQAELLGMYFADAGQHFEHRLFVDHAVPSCRSRVTYKGALQGKDARTVWVGDVLIRANAEGTDTYESNRNLVLSEGARADSVPNLEIETGEITGAGHASATGRFDDEQLFYLQARGIPEAEARRLVVRGFFAELINQVGVPSLTERLHRAVEAELEGAGA